MTNKEAQPNAHLVTETIYKALAEFDFNKPDSITYVNDLYKNDRKFATIVETSNSINLIVDERLKNLIETAHPSITHNYVSALESAVQVAALYKDGVDEHKATLRESGDSKRLNYWAVGNGVAFIFAAYGAAGNVDFAEYTNKEISNVVPQSILFAVGVSEAIRQVKKDLPLHEIYKDAVHEVVGNNKNNVGFENLNIIAKSIDRTESVIGNIQKAVNGALEAMLDPEKYKPNFVENIIKGNNAVNEAVRG